ncbi:MAG TPA: UDP-3-O-(3-hydroxymyristoyl)glucosamine N-acyltransferase [Thermoanaerobaculia bacterium]|nr:UDP-3-O-(3-hydroxymyristoyl)glucosamine N-acyltransferase [Thermoanaerobaculia bacterium]
MGSFRLGELAALVGGEVAGDPERRVEAVRPLDVAGPADLSFLTHPRYREQAESSRAGALLVSAEARGLRTGADLLVCADPYHALSRILDHVHPRPPVTPGIHPTAVVGESCAIDPSASVGPYAVIGDECTIGPGAVIGPHSCLGPRCAVGAGATLHAHAVLYDRVTVGAGTVVHSGAVLGADGFGYATHGGAQVKVPQVGCVVLEEEVEVGANSAVDRATFEATRIGRGTKLDNLVQVGHNVQIGRDCLLCGQTGIAGSARVGDRVVFAGQAGAAGHLTVGDDVQVAAQAAVLGSVESGRVGGTPAVDLALWRRQVVALQKLPAALRRLSRLEKELARLREREAGAREPGVGAD